MLVAYSGKDTDELPPDGRENRPERAYSMFLAGSDTFDISRRFGLLERTILRWVTRERCRRLGIPEPTVCKKYSRHAAYRKG